MKTKRFGTTGRPSSFPIWMMTSKTTTSLVKVRDLEVFKMWRIIALMSMQNAAGESCSLASAAGYFCYYANLMHIYLKKKKKQTKKSVSV